MLKKIICLSIIGLITLENCNAMRVFNNSINACKTSKLCLDAAISDKFRRKGAVKCCAHKKEYAYDIFIDAFEAKQLSLCLDNKDVLLMNHDYSLRYFRIEEGVCKIANHILGIRQRVFAFKRNFEFVRLPESLLGIDSMAFGNTNLKEVYIPDSVIAIAPYAFFNCKNLEKVSIPSTALVLDNAFSGCQKAEITYRYPKKN